MYKKPVSLADCADLHSKVPDYLGKNGFFKNRAVAIYSALGTGLLMANTDWEICEVALGSYCMDKRKVKVF